MTEREYRDQEKRGKHPSACTCAICTDRRLRRIERSRNPIRRLLDFLMGRR